MVVKIDHAVILYRSPRDRCQNPPIDRGTRRQREMLGAPGKSPGEPLQDNFLAAQQFSLERDRSFWAGSRCT